MIKSRIEIDSISADEFHRLIRDAVDGAVTPLLDHVEELTRQLRTTRRVITHKEAPAFFAFDVRAETIVDYIKRE